MRSFGGFRLINWTTEATWSRHAGWLMGSHHVRLLKSRCHFRLFIISLTFWRLKDESINRLLKSRPSVQLWSTYTITSVWQLHKLLHYSTIKTLTSAEEQPRFSLITRVRYSSSSQSVKTHPRFESIFVSFLVKHLITQWHDERTHNISVTCIYFWTSNHVKRKCVSS